MRVQLLDLSREGASWVRMRTSVRCGFDISLSHMGMLCVGSMTDTIPHKSFFLEKEDGI